MRALFTFLALCLLLFTGYCDRSKYVFDFDWKFQLANTSSSPSGSVSAFPPCNQDFCQPGYDDSNWRTLDIPHDFVIEGKFDPKGDESHGYLPKGVGRYRKHFTIPSQLFGKTLWLEFDGVYRNSNVWLNGYLLGNHPSGYTSFYYVINSLVKLNGADNVLVVEADARSNEGWWYEGGGIYRHVWLYATDPVRISPWGVFITSRVTGEISHTTNIDGILTPQATSAQASISVNLTSDIQVNTFNANVMFQILDQGGNSVGKTTAVASMKNGTGSVSASISLSDVTLWHVKASYLYRLVTTVTYNQFEDSVTTNFGIRKVVFDKDNGLFLNDASVKVFGFCNHQDFAGLGTALPNRVNEFRVTKLQEMGANGWRMSHNPPNSELLDYTDSLGMLVWDENRNFGDSQQYLSDVSTLPQRDRNHPSIIIWSLCNEGGCSEGANDTSALKIATTLKSIINEYDGTRPVSGAWNSNLEDLLYGWGPKVMDVQGINYNYGEIDPYHAKYPDKPLIGSETASCTCARGIYRTNDTMTHKSVFTADGCMQEWWSSIASRPHIAGGFAWTGFDYKGEPTPYSWPDVNSNFGVIDLAGFPKDAFWYYQAQWTTSPVVHVFPHWNQPNLDPTMIVASSCSIKSSAQMFTFTGGDNTPGQIITSSGLCIDATCANPSQGCEPLKAVQCSSTDNQRFIHQSDGSFKNVANGGCMDLWNSGTGPDVGVYTCDGLSNQKWTFQGKQLVSGASGDRCLTQGDLQSVWVYSNADSVELIVNGNSLGNKTVPQYGHVEWDGINWAPGQIIAKGYNKQGGLVGTDTQVTSGQPAAVRLSLEFPTNGIVADRQDAALLTAQIVDSQGRLVPTASNYIQFQISGPGVILGVGNGDPSCHEPDKGTGRSAFGGLARVIIGSTNQSGRIVVTASSSGLQSGSANVDSSTPEQIILSL